ASTTQEGKEMIQTFIDKWQKRYPRMTHSLQETENLLTFTQFPKGFCCEV
ncbi:transposase, partial [Enterococcus faecium]